MIRRMICIALVIGLTAFSWGAETPSSSPARAAGELAVGDRLPELRGGYLSGRKALLPDDASGHVAVLLLGFSYASRLAVQAWAKRFRAEFAGDPRLTCYQVPMIGGMGRMGKWFIESGMRRGTPKADYEHVITVYGGTEPWQQRLGVKDEDWAYVVVLDAKGKVAWRTAGPFEEARYQALSTELRKLVSAQ